ncbi:MAG: hypothetical protein QXH51_06765 [Candidatus Bathyarchaeia archaeon]
MVYLEVIYELKNGRLRRRKYELKDYEKAFDKWCKVCNGRIYLRETIDRYEPSFDGFIIEKYFRTEEGHLYAAEDLYFQIFVRWLKEQLVMWNESRGVELIKE